MAVFWFGWTKKLKNIFTKKEADALYLQKELPNQLQIVKGNVDFYKNVVIKQNGYVDRVDTNSNTAIPNKKYVDDQLTTVRTYTDTKFQDTINPLNTRLTTLEQKKSLTTTVFYEYDGDWANGSSIKFTKSNLDGFYNNFIVVRFNVAGVVYNQIIYIPDFTLNIALPFIGISGYLTSNYPNVNVGFMINCVYKSSNYQFTITAVKSDTNLTFNTFKIYSIS